MGMSDFNLLSVDVPRDDNTNNQQKTTTNSTTYDNNFS